MYYHPTTQAFQENRQTYLFQRKACLNFARIVETKFPSLEKNLPSLRIKVRNLEIFTPTACSKNDHHIIFLHSHISPALAPFPQALSRNPPSSNTHTSGHPPKVRSCSPYFPINSHPHSPSSHSWQSVSTIPNLHELEENSTFQYVQFNVPSPFWVKNTTGCTNMSFFLIFNRQRRESIISLQKIFEAC